ncbi:hypothetical protein RSAG8_06003, partial [Rhizoctonia solani AG-8 WAC10335]
MTHYALNTGPSQTDVCAPITTLSLSLSKGDSPPWTTPAYRGLVELRLNAARYHSISETRLIAIPISSPTLQLLEFDISVTTQPGSSDVPFTIPVRLDDLHTVITGQLTLLPLIAPGSIALDVTLLKPSKFPVKCKEVRDFFTRSNVTSIRITDWISYMQLVDLLALAPRVQTILSTSDSHTEVGEIPPPKRSLRTLVLTENARIRLEDLQRFTEALQVQELVLAGNDKIVYNHRLVHDSEAFESLLTICPSIKISSIESCLGAWRWLK